MYIAKALFKYKDFYHSEKMKLFFLLLINK